MKKKKTLGFVLLISLLILGGCQLHNKPTEKDVKVLRILIDDAFGNVEEIHETYIQLFEIKHPDIELELISRNLIAQQMKPGDHDILTRLEMRYPLLKHSMSLPNGPDVVLLSDEELIFMIEENLLYPLEPFIEKSGFDLENIGYGVREGLRDLGHGTLYALSPYFYSKALFYNKDYFDKRGIHYPKEGISYEELFSLAKELSYEENGVKYFGLTFGEGHSSINSYFFDNYVESIELPFIDEEVNSAINSLDWEMAWFDFVDLHNSGVVPSTLDYRDDDIPSFHNGRVAITIGDRRDILRLVNQSQEDIEQNFVWDIISIPSHPKLPDTSIEAYYMNMQWRLI